MDWNVVKFCIKKVGHVESTKDKYEIFDATIASKFKDFLKNERKDPS
jgi:hypothetical protein